MAITYFKGDAAEYTGESEVLYGGLFYAIRMLEGLDAGKLCYTSRPPDGSESEDDKRRRASREEMQAGRYRWPVKRGLTRRAERQCWSGSVASPCWQD